MIINAIKTPRFKYPDNNIDDLLKYVPELEEKTVLIITSKVISICEGNIESMSDITHDELINRLADARLEPKKLKKKDGSVLTKVGNLLIESAGIDKNKKKHYFILLPNNPAKTALNIWTKLKKRDGIKQLGVVITDSHSVPGRKGAIGLALASYGFKPVVSYTKSSMADVADGIAAAGVLEMGELTEITPLAIAEDVHNARFYKKFIPLRVNSRYSWVKPDLDVYAPLLDSKEWRITKNDK
jgi:F420-0:gamma-glutamyl ligase